MPKRTNLAIAPLLALAVGSVGALLAPAASAASPYTNAEWSPDRHVAANNCTTSYDPVATPTNAPIAADGARHVFGQAYTATVTNSGDPTDITHVSVSQDSVGILGSKGTDPSAFSMAFSGKAIVKSDKPSPACQVSGYAQTNLSFEFTLTKPKWVDVSLTNRGVSTTELTIWNSNNPPYLFVYDYGVKFDTTGRAYLPAGEYNGTLEGEISLDPTGNAGSSGSMKATFTTPGSRTTGPSGKAKPYIALGASRNCTSHTLATKVTTSKKRAKTIKKIVIRVNGHKVKTVKSHFRGRAIPLTLADTKAANVKATVTTVQKKKHHKKIRKSRTVSANYLACS